MYANNGSYIKETVNDNDLDDKSTLKNSEMDNQDSKDPKLQSFQSASTLRFDSSDHLEKATQKCDVIRKEKSKDDILSDLEDYSEDRKNTGNNSGKSFDEGWENGYREGYKERKQREEKQDKVTEDRYSSFLSMLARLEEVYMSHGNSDKDTVPNRLIRAHIKNSSGVGPNYTDVKPSWSDFAGWHIYRSFLNAGDYEGTSPENCCLWFFDLMRKKRYFGSVDRLEFELVPDNNSKASKKVAKKIRFSWPDKSVISPATSSERISEQNNLKDLTNDFS